MPDVFEDTVGTYDLTITTSADWTVSSGGLPNGDNYVTPDGTVAATYNTSGSAFDISDGTAWTVELMIYIGTSSATLEYVIVNADAGTTTKAWDVSLTSASVTFTLRNTGGSSYLAAGTGTLATGTWHHLVFIKETGNTLSCYANNSFVENDTTTSGSVRTPTGTYYIYLGTDGNGANDMGAVASSRLAKVAIYNSQLSTGQINDHYLSMFAT